ncbi:uncharacterized protein [Paramormyrops kingsleyae]|uniref:uncharacterized protein n=1 Tax=Paramormyrops kingsleyae TaxID=1676925 RepID=UPI003B96B5D3
MLGMCVTLLALFREYGWPQKVPIPVRYRALQLRYSLDDYSSKGSSLAAVKKVHRNLQASESEGTAQTVSLTAHEFWDYEQQVDLEAFSSTMFFEVLLRHSVSVTARLGQLRTEVRELYQVVAGWFRALRGLGGRATGTVPLGYEELRRHVEKEQGRRRALATQLGRLLDSQLRVLQMEMMARRQAQQDFGARLREALRLLEQPPLHAEQPWDQQLQHAQDRLSTLASQMVDLASRECQRQGAWAILGEGTGAQLLCPTRGMVLTKEEIIAADGVIVAIEAVSVDPCTGLLVPKPNARMRVPSGHTMPVPSDFVLHPETGRLLPMAGNVAYNPASSTLMITADTRAAEPARWDTPLLPFVPFPLSRHGPITCQLRGLLPGQRMVLGGPMCDPKTGVLVPILAVTIHPVSGLVFPLGGVHMCPLTGLPRPIQVGAPMQEPESGSIALVTGVSLNPLTGEVVPVGGVLLGESFVEPLSGREARVRGAGLRGGKLVPHAGGYQALLDSQALAACMRVAELLQVAVRSSGRGRRGGVRAAGAEMERAWRSSEHCLLQMVCRLEVMQDWAWWLAQDAGVQGEIQFPGSDLRLPALPGLEYPDPGGSGLRVPVLGSQLDWASGRMVPLAGTMEDANGGGLVPIRIGSQTVDPNSGAMGPVVGARFDSLRKSVVPITASDRLAEGRKDTVLMDILQRECSLRSTFWVQQRQQEEELLRDLERSLHHCFQAATQSTEHVQNCQAQWRERERQFQGTVAEMNQQKEAEAQRSAEGRSHLHLLLPVQVFVILTEDDEQQRERQVWWQEELAAGLERISVTIDRLQQERDRWMVQHSMERPLLLKEQWEQLNSRLVELEVALTVQHCVREHSQLRMDTAKAVLSGSFWYKDFGLPYIRGPSETQGTEAVVQHRVLPLLQRLLYLLEEQKQGNKESPGTSTQSLKPVDKSKSSGPWTNQLYSQENQKKALQTVLQGKVQDWEELLPLSPLFQQLRSLEEQLRSLAVEKGILGGCRGSHSTGGRQPFIDLLDAQWECEGELVPLSPDCLNAREVLLYQYGVSLLQALHNHAEAPALTLQISASLPPNGYHGNPFCNSFFYQESGSTLFVRRQRLRSAGSFSLLLLHCVSHIIIGDMGTDDHQFQRVFFRMLEFTLTEGFESKLATCTAEDLQHTGQEDLHFDQGTMSESGLISLLVNRTQGSACRPLSDNGHMPERLEKHRKAAGLWHLGDLLRDMRSEVRRSCRTAQPHSPQSVGPPPGL